MTREPPGFRHDRTLHETDERPPARRMLIRAAPRSGQPLPDALRRRLERVLNTSLGDVRVHMSSERASAASAVAAGAYTIGPDIYFSCGGPTATDAVDVSEPHEAAEQQANQFAAAFARREDSPGPRMVSVRSGADHRSPAAPAQTTDLIGDLLAHEIGHTVYARNPALREQFEKVAGWEHLDLAELEARIARDQLGEKTYKVDPFSACPIVAHDDEAMPVGWDHARTNPKEQFADHYRRAVAAPEQLHDDLIESPDHMVTTWESHVRSIQESIAARRREAEAYTQLASHLVRLTPDVIRTLTWDMEQLRAAESRQKIAVSNLEEWRRRRDKLRRVYEFFRNEVFNAPELVAAAEARMRAGGVDQARLAAFRAEAVKAHTPQQVAILEAKHAR